MAPTTHAYANDTFDGVEILGSKPVESRVNKAKRQSSRKRSPPMDEDEDISDAAVDGGDASDESYEPESEVDGAALTISDPRAISVATSGSGRGSRRSRPPESRIVKGRTSRKKPRQDLSNEQLWTKVDELEGMLKTAREKKRHQVNVKGKKSDQIEKLKGERDRLKDRVLRLESDKEKLKQDVTEWKDKYNLAKLALRETEERLELLQAESRELLSKGKFPVQPDNDVEYALSNILKDLGQWAKKWTVKDWRKISPDDATRLCTALCGGAYTKFASSRLRKALLMGKVPIRVIANAMVNRVVCYKTLVHPFAALKTDSSLQYSATADDKFKWIFDSAKKSLCISRVPLCCTNH